jgi:hypothetical protein
VILARLSCAAFFAPQFWKFGVGRARQRANLFN